MHIRRFELTALALFTVAGCCSDHPELCVHEPSPLDAGVAPCWTEANAPLRTEATSEGPTELSILHCQRVEEGHCRRGLVLGQPGGNWTRAIHAPGGIWLTTARGFGCPAQSCASVVGLSRAVAVPPPPNKASEGNDSDSEGVRSAPSRQRPRSRRRSRTRGAARSRRGGKRRMGVEIAAAARVIS